MIRSLSQASSSTLWVPISLDFSEPLLFFFNDGFLRILINPVNFAVLFLKRKIWMKVSGPFPCLRQQAAVPLWGGVMGLCSGSYQGKHTGIRCFGIHLFSYLDRFYERHWWSVHQLLSCTLTEPLCVTVRACLPTSLPLWYFAICLQRQGLYSERAYYCLTLGKLQRMSVYLIIQYPDTISFPDTVLFH